jgi:acetoin utilization protein AcuB
LTGQSCFINEDRHVYDLIKISTEHELNSVAVVNEEGIYQGVVNIADTLAFFSASATVQSPGGILILSINSRDYTLSEISRLVESEDAKIIGSSLINDPNDLNKLKLTLKLNKTDLSRVTATLERFGYHIIAQYQEVVNKSNEKERLEILLKYLDI